MEVDKVAEIRADMELEMVADMEVDKVADMEVDMKAKKIYSQSLEDTQVGG